MGLVDVLLPPACAGCGSAGKVFCDACVASLRRPSDPADRFIGPDAGVVVGDQLICAVAAFVHEGRLRSALGRLKYAGASRAADPLAAACLPALCDLLAVCGAAPLVPVPVHPDRQRERGYNQARLLADALGRRAGLPVAELLSRVRSTTKQHRLDRAARLRNLREAFAPARRARAPPTAILVDDILTTSATLEACAGALQAGGAEAVYGLVVAREI